MDPADSGEPADSVWKGSIGAGDIESDPKTGKLSAETPCIPYPQKGEGTDQGNGAGTRRAGL